SCLPQLVYQKDGHEIELLDKYKALHLSWCGQVDNEIYRHFSTKMLEFAIEFQIEHWLYDAREIECMEVPDKEWCKHYFGKDILRSPIRKIARIASGNFENETNISGIITTVLKETQAPYEFSYQPDACTAFEWFAGKSLENDCL